MMGMTGMCVMEIRRRDPVSILRQVRVRGKTRTRFKRLSGSEMQDGDPPGFNCNVLSILKAI